MTIVQLGLFGFLGPLALGTAAQVLPLYLGLRLLAAWALWLVFSGYVAGVALSLLSLWLDSASTRTGLLNGIATLLLGSALLVFTVLQGMFLPPRWRRLMLPAVQTKRVSAPVRPYPVAQGNDRAAFGLFVWLIRSAFGWPWRRWRSVSMEWFSLWVALAPISADAMRHATTVGFIMLLIFGVGQRMLPGFAGRKLLSPR